MSILSIAQATRGFWDESLVRTIVCTAPGEPEIARFTKFENNETILSLTEVVNCWRKHEVLLHIPEVYVQPTLDWLEMQSTPRDLRINILLQNVDHAPSSAQVRALCAYGSITCTTAHEAYSTNAMSRELGCEVTHISVAADPFDYVQTDFSRKRKLVVYSPDMVADKRTVIAALAASLGEYKFVEIFDLSYSQYRELIGGARYSLTFGEGLDFYFAETIYSGGIGAAVYNDRFFTSSFETLPFIYTSWNDLVKRFPSDVRRCENRSEYERAHNKQFGLLATIYSRDDFLSKLERFYSSVYDS